MLLTPPCGAGHFIRILLESLHFLSSNIDLATSRAQKKRPTWNTEAIVSIGLVGHHGEAWLPLGREELRGGPPQGAAF